MKPKREQEVENKRQKKMTGENLWSEMKEETSLCFVLFSSR
jgi:hypothetical protein